MPTIADRQNDPSLLRFLAAARAYYDRAQWWHRLRVLGTTVFGALGVIITLAAEDAAPYVGAAAGLWVLFARTLFDWLERTTFECAATAQEQFDSALFALPWNASIAGNRIADEDIADAARRAGVADVRDWYPAAADRLAWPANVAVCQRASAAWGRRTNNAYAFVVAAAGIAWLLVTVAVALAVDASLAAYLLGLFLPSQPALMDALAIWRTHREIARRKERVERAAEDLLLAGEVTAEACRGIQDQVFEIRRQPPRVPNFFYAARRERDQRAMEEAADALVTRASERRTLT